jgi:hypothetical protein
MSLFLTDEEIQDLTERKRRSAQIRWLQRNGIKHTLSADGHPRVLRSHLERILGGSSRPAATQPNADALKNYMNGQKAHQG